MMPFPGASNLDRLRALLAELGQRAKMAKPDEPLPAVVQKWFEVLVESTDRLHNLAERFLALEESLEVERNHLLLMIKTAFSAVVWMDSSGVVGAWNPAAEKLFGWVEAEAVGQPLDQLIIPERYRELHRAGLARFLQTGTSNLFFRNIRAPVVHKDGHEFIVELTIGTARDRDAFRFFAFIRTASPLEDCVEIDKLLATNASVQQQKA